MAYIKFNDGGVGAPITLDNGTRSISGGAGSRFVDWNPIQRPVGPAVTALGTGRRYQYAFRTDYGASFSMTDIPNTKMSDMLRCQAHLVGGGLVEVWTEDSGGRNYTSCCLAPEGDVTIALSDKSALLYTMTFAVINVAASPSAMLCQY